MRRMRAGRTMVAGLTVMTLALAACGADPVASNDGVASLDEDAATSETVAESPEAPSDPEQAFARFEACMEENGVDLPDPESGGGLEVQRSQDGPGDGDGASMMVDGVEVDPEVFDAAEKACRPHLANVDRGFEMTPEQEAAIEDANLAFQECMNEHGIEGQFGMAFGSAGDGGLDLSESNDEADPQAAAPGGGGTVDEEALHAATEECMKVFEDSPELEGLFEDMPELGGASHVPGE